MSTKASPLNATRANNSPTDSTMNTSTPTATPTAVKIKKELPSDEIKEFAESTMNELLGWYGFDSVDRLDLSAKPSKLLQTTCINSGQQSQHQTHHLEKRRSRTSRIASLLHMQQQQQPPQQQNEHLRTINNNNYNNSKSSNNNNNDNSSCSSLNNRKTTSNCKNNNSNNYRGNDSTTSDHDTRSSRDDDSKSPHSTGKIHAITVHIDDNLVDYQNCCWCRRPVPENAPEFLTTSDGPRYCSESCFTQSRRASFKKAKTCDWCKHIRHAVSYVDFQDGASQLQFCSDKCLNQYKMQIFCKETQAHLDMNPHLKEQGLEAANNGANLITPDLWLKNCRSRSASPASTVSISPGPSCQTNMAKERVKALTVAISPPPKLATTSSVPSNSNTSHKPLISVAPVSKLMSKSPSVVPARQSPKHNRKKKPVKSCVSADIGNARAAEVKPNSSASLASSVSNKQNPLLAALVENSRSNLNQTNTQTLTQFAASCVQDLHMNVPPLSPMMESQSSQPTTPHSLPPTPNRGHNMPPAFFSTPPINQGHQPSQPVSITPQGFAQRPAFLNNPNGSFVPHFSGNFPGLPLPPPHALGLMPPDLAALNTLIGTPPPVTVMVPYPVIIPLPIPIPVPLPIVDFYKAHLSPDERKKFDEEQKKAERKTIVISLAEVSEEPLDFTKTKEADVEVAKECAENTSSTGIKEQKQDLTSSSRKNTKEETSPVNSTSCEDSPQSTSKSLHCILTSEENEQNSGNAITTSKLKSDFVSNSQDIIDDPIEIQSSTTGGEETNQKLPKLKITRLQAKRTLIQTKESEYSRPLRKRKRIIDCDFQKLGTSSNHHNNEASDVADELITTTENEQKNKGQNTNSNNNKK